ncbi:MAG TPA: hypothetical protein VN285_00850 [Candidatus Deferrimicrobium sp.]|nr:hypothetical protein [Candidatus Deferrimicrobium sp.]
MQNKRCKTIGLTVVAAAAMILWLTTCDDDGPTKPVPVKDYVFYMNDGGYFDRYYRYFSGAAKVDSLTIPYGSGRGLAVSADGTRLYLGDGAKTTVVSTDSFKLMTTINYYNGGGVAVSPDNRLVAIQGKDGLYILNTSDYSLLFHDTTQVARGVFTPDSRMFYCLGGGGVYSVDLSDQLFPVGKKPYPYPVIWKIVPSHDEDKWFLLVYYGSCASSFEVYDVSLDSIIFRDSLFHNGYGDMVLSPDGQLLFYTMPGTIMICGSDPPARLTVFDVDKNEISKRILIPGHLPGSYLLAQNLALTPDGRRLLTDGAAGHGQFVVIDVATMKVVESYYLGNQVDIWDVSCQNAP